MDSDEVVMTKKLEEQFLNSLKAKGRKSQTICTYRRSMDELYSFLPEDKQITNERLEEWKAFLRESRYAEATINIRMTAVNGLLKYCGKERRAPAHGRARCYEGQPELTRAEYLEFLSAAQRIGTRQDYLLIKVFATVDIRIQELPYITVEALNEGTLILSDGRRSIVPPSLVHEILEFAEKRGIESGPVFVTRNGNAVDRSNVARAIRNLAHDAGMDPEKCCPRALHRVYQRTQEELKEKILPIYLQTYDNLLCTEQVLAAWQ